MAARPGDAAPGAARPACRRIPATAEQQNSSPWDESRAGRSAAGALVTACKTRELLGDNVREMNVGS